MSLHFNDRSGKCRYSPYIINLAFTLYLQNENYYDRLCTTELSTLHHPNTLEKITRVMKFQPEFGPTIYQTMK